MCVNATAEAERKVAAEKQAGIVSVENGEALEHVCSTCKRSLPTSSFNRTQLSKGIEKQRCQECVSVSEKEIAETTEGLRRQKIEEARRKVTQLDATGTAAERCAAAANLAALEAQAVTGLKPVVLGNGRGRGRGRSRGR